MVGEARGGSCPEAAAEGPSPVPADAEKPDSAAEPVPAAAAEGPTSAAEPVPEPAAAEAPGSTAGSEPVARNPGPHVPGPDHTSAPATATNSATVAARAIAARPGRGRSTGSSRASGVVRRNSPLTGRDVRQTRATPPAALWTTAGCGQRGAAVPPVSG